MGCDLTHDLPKRPGIRLLTDEQEADVLARLLNGERPEQLAVDFNVHFNTILNAKRRALRRVKEKFMSRTGGASPASA